MASDRKQKSTAGPVLIIAASASSDSSAHRMAVAVNEVWASDDSASIVAKPAGGVAARA